MHLLVWKCMRITTNSNKNFTIIIFNYTSISNSYGNVIVSGLSFRSKLYMRENNTNNYVERSFGILMDIVIARTKAYNCVQVFHFIIMNMERFYALRLLSFAHRHPGHLRLAKRFLCPGWNTVNMDTI